MSVLILGVLIVHGEGFIDGSDDLETDGLFLGGSGAFPSWSVGFVHGVVSFQAQKRPSRGGRAVVRTV